MLLLAGVALVSWAPTATPGSGAANGYWQCDRQCRGAYGFFDRNVTGAETGHLRHKICQCSNSNVSLGTAPYEETGTPVTTSAGTFEHAKPFDNAYWCDQYSTPFLCTLGATAGAKPQTMDCGAGGAASLDACAAKAKAAGKLVLHCGKCGACSALSDIQVLYTTRHNITTEMTRCSKDFALSNLWPFHKQQTLADLERCLTAAGITFSTDGRAWGEPSGKPSCMQCWTDNILNDKEVCTSHCLSKFIDPTNNKPYEKDGCLQCDEYSSGPDFIKCAGANRRSSGIISDIDRGPGQVCPVGYCTGKAQCF